MTESAARSRARSDRALRPMTSATTSSHSEDASMTAETIHTYSYECERPECIRAQRDELAARLTAETSNARGGVEYEYEVWQDGDVQAGGSAPDYASAKSEANHYAMMYIPDRPVEVRIYEKRLLSANKVEPKRRRYDPNGSLSEYGIFPECDAQPPADDEVVFIDGVG